MMDEIICLLIPKFYKAGDKPPKDYLGWHDLAGVQRRAGITQKQCRCGKWVTPQEHEDHIECVNAS